MQSNILLFLLFSFIVSALLRILPTRLKRYGLFFFNISFYLLCDAKFFLLVIIGTIWSFVVGRWLCTTTKRKTLLWIGIIPIIGVLCLFKYYNFFVPNSKNVLALVMPLGISYYTFKIISYIADIYSDKYEPETSIMNYSIYVSFFPQIICGPISRCKNITEQIKNLFTPSEQMTVNGCMLILSGLFKKLVIADRLNSYVNAIFAAPASYPSLALWMSAFFYTVQIYCDFSGYSEIAIGVSNLLGIECSPNFNTPYFAHSIKDFWHRWHISLSSWLKDYIYIPLGGSRKGKIRKHLNTLITFLVSGLWHGTGLNFICWGLYHGILSLFSAKKSASTWTNILQISGTFFAVMFGWILFRASSLHQGIQYIYYMFRHISLDTTSIVTSILPFTGDYSCLSYLLTVCLFITILFIIELREIMHKTNFSQKEIYVKCFIYISSIILFGMIGQNSFLYANF